MVSAMNELELSWRLDASKRIQSIVASRASFAAHKSSTVSTENAWKDKTLQKGERILSLLEL